MTEIEPLRVSVAALCRVIFPHPQTGANMLALERRATWSINQARIRAQPFGGALRIIDPTKFRATIGDYSYDSVRSSEEQDLRIIIPSTAWKTVKEFILAQMRLNRSSMIEIDPCRELEEEFLESIGINLLPEHYTCRPIGISVQDRPIPTNNSRSLDVLTLRIYRIFEVLLSDLKINETILENSQRFTDNDLLLTAKADASHGGLGRANGVLVMPFADVRAAYFGRQPMEEMDSLFIQGHFFESTTVLLFDLTIPKSNA